MKDPAILFYTSDFLSGTMFMTDEQVGKYIRLLCAQHQNGHLQEKHMLKICGTYDLDIFCKFTKDDTGLYFNERMDKEVLKRSKYSESRSNNRKSVKKPEDKSNICLSYVNHMGNENDNRNDNLNSSREESVREEKIDPTTPVNDEEITPVQIVTALTFDEFWELYDKKVGLKEKVRKRFEAITEKDREKMIDHISDYKLSQPDKQYRKDPMTYLNNKSWNDEIIFKNGNQQRNPKGGATDAELTDLFANLYGVKQQ